MKWGSVPQVLKTALFIIAIVIKEYIQNNTSNIAVTTMRAYVTSFAVQYMYTAFHSVCVREKKQQIRKFMHFYRIELNSSNNGKARYPL